MSDDLRTRIAAVVRDCFTWGGDKLALTIADAVIRELGLREEWGALDDDDGGFLADTREQLRLGKGETIKRRYITDWEPADE